MSRQYLTPFEAQQLMREKPDQFLYWYNGERVEEIERRNGGATWRLSHGDDFHIANARQYELLEAEPLDVEDIRQRCRLLLEAVHENDLIDTFDDLCGTIRWRQECEEHSKGKRE